MNSKGQSMKELTKSHSSSGEVVHGGYVSSHSICMGLLYLSRSGLNFFLRVDWTFNWANRPSYCAPWQRSEAFLGRSIWIYKGFLRWGIFLCRNLLWAWMRDWGRLKGGYSEGRWPILATWRVFYGGDSYTAGRVSTWRYFPMPLYKGPGKTIADSVRAVGASMVSKAKNKVLYL